MNLKKEIMTPEEQRIAIAEACGWTCIVFVGLFGEKDYRGVHESCRPKGKTGKWQGRIPDYLNDLNAMHEAEKILKPGTDEEADYLVFLARLTNCKPSFATAAQRAEAFLRVLDLWKD
jgi:hypothetical protein